MLPALRFVVGDTQWVLSTHALLVVVAVFVGTVHAVRRAREPLVVAACAPWVAAAGIAGSRALFAVLRGGDGTLWSGGLTSMGGIAAGLAVVVVAARVARVRTATLLDAFVPAGLLALGIGRLGCFLGGCCYGAPTSLPWGLVFPEVGGAPRHPLQLYSALLDVGLVALLGRVSGPPGAVARAGCVGFGLGRAALELMRDPGTRDLVGGGMLTVAQAGALGLAAVALVVKPARRSNPLGLRNRIEV
ncbi:MAG TPA: prolipoprotein diacylglyceryl transferase family protein [Candidatus Binatia bacterium]|jgi:phosphatidylglycerol:prolipoprotein diacylglycerol transferase|nr:prolipoprotein diacylglyceryl transferase family protein [Candidatus Binatia bacterium]